MKHIFSITRNSILVAGLLFSSLYSQGIQEWLMDNPCKALVAGAVTVYGIYYGATHCKKKSVKAKAKRAGKVKVDTHKIDSKGVLEEDLFFDEYTGAIVEEDIVEEDIVEDDIFEDIDEEEEDNFFALINNDEDATDVVMTDDGNVAAIEDFVFAGDVTDYQDFLQDHQDEYGNTFLHNFVSNLMHLTEEEAFEKAPEMLMEFYQKIYGDENLTYEDVSEIAAKLTYGHPESNEELYAQLLFLRNNEGKTAKEIAAEGTTEWSQQLFKLLDEEENAMLPYLQKEDIA